MSGELTEEEFKPLRLMNGIYLQLHAYMADLDTLRHRVVEQFRMLAHVGRRYDRGYGHFTTRQNIQFNWIKLADLPDALADLAASGLHAHADQRQLRAQHHDRSMGRRRLRRDRGPAHLGGNFRQHTTLHPEFSVLPRKFKIAVGGQREIAPPSRCTTWGCASTATAPAKPASR